MMGRALAISVAACVLASGVVAGGCSASSGEGSSSTGEAQTAASKVRIVPGWERAHANEAALRGASDADIEASSIHFGNAYWLARITDIGYRVGDPAIKQGMADIGLPDVTIFANTCSGAYAYYASTPTFQILTFRGTDLHGWDDPDTITDIEVDLLSMKSAWEGPGLVHAGFLLQLDSIWTADAKCGVAQGLRDFLEARAGRGDLYVTGHSLGAALATLAVARIDLDSPPKIPVAGLYTFGSPKVGTSAFALDTANRARGRTPIFRVVHADDIITVIPRNLDPFEFTHYEHVGYEGGGEDTFQVWMDGDDLSIASFVLRVAWNPDDHYTSRYIADAETQARKRGQLP